MKLFKSKKEKTIIELCDLRSRGTQPKGNKLIARGGHICEIH